MNHVNSIKGPQGNSALDVDLNVVANMPIYAMTMPWKVLGGTYGWMTIFPVVNTRFVANQFNASAESGGLSDLFFAPVVLGWTKGNADFTVNYGFYPPSGEFNPALPLNPGLGISSIRFRLAQPTPSASQNSGTLPC